MKKRTPSENRNIGLIIGGILFTLLILYVLLFQYLKARHFVFAVGHRITADNLPHILSALAWPSAVIVSVFVLRVALRSLIDRIDRASVGGDKGPALDFAHVGKVDATPAPEEPKAVEGVTFKERVKVNVANAYWVGSDLMTLFHIILRGGSRDEMLRMFRQVNHHLKVLRLKDSPLYIRFRRLYDSTEASLDNDWTQARRIETVREIQSIVGAFGRLVEETQPGFSGDPQTSANL
jgi:hypothetical protein